MCSSVLVDFSSLLLDHQIIIGFLFLPYRIPYSLSSSRAFFSGRGARHCSANVPREDERATQVSKIEADIFSFLCSCIANEKSSFLENISANFSSRFDSFGIGRQAYALYYE